MLEIWFHMGCYRGRLTRQSPYLRILKISAAAEVTLAGIDQQRGLASELLQIQATFLSSAASIDVEETPTRQLARLLTCRHLRQCLLKPKTSGFGCMSKYVGLLLTLPSVVDISHRGSARI